MPTYALPWAEYVKTQAQEAAMRAASGLEDMKGDFREAVNGKAMEKHTDEMTRSMGGGRCIMPVVLHPADVLLSTRSAWNSFGVRLGTRSTISHAALYLGAARVLDATIKFGVAERSVAALVSESSIVCAFRHRKITGAIAQEIITAARAELGKGYDIAGAIIGGGMSQIMGDSAALLQRDDAFYCSELVAGAFAAAGLPLAGVGQRANTPEDLPDSADLRYIGHVKYQPRM